MRIKAATYRSQLCAVFVCVLAPAITSAQHVHGVIELGVVVEGSTVAVSLSAPMSDVVGFEHAPDGDEQVETIKQAAALVSDADEMFGLPGAAGCEATRASIEGPAFVMQYINDSHAESEEHDHHSDDADHDHHDDHGHDGDDDHHDDHDHDHEEGHSEINATYEWACSDAAKLDTLDLRFADGFSGVEKIEVQILTSAGANVITVAGDARQISLAPR